MGVSTGSRDAQITHILRWHLLPNKMEVIILGEVVLRDKALSVPVERNVINEFVVLISK